MVRKALILAAVGLLLGVSSGAAGRVGTPRHLSRMSSFESQVLEQMNAIRAKRGLKPLRISPGLRVAAAGHSTQMVRRGYFKHDSVDGTSMPDRVVRYYPSRGHRYWSVGENLLWASPSMSPADALAEWMNDPGHRANILTAEWREVGFGALHVKSAPGVYEGSPVTILTADFGVRR